MSLARAQSGTYRQTWATPHIYSQDRHTHEHGRQVWRDRHDNTLSPCRTETWTGSDRRHRAGIMKIHRPNEKFARCSLVSPEAGGEDSPSVAVQEVDGEAFEGVPVWHCFLHSILELLVATGEASAALHLIGPQCWGQQVGQVVIPHGCQAQVLQDKTSRFNVSAPCRSNALFLQAHTSSMT